MDFIHEFSTKRLYVFDGLRKNIVIGGGESSPPETLR